MQIIVNEAAITLTQTALSLNLTAGSATITLTNPVASLLLTVPPPTIDVIYASDTRAEGYQAVSAGTSPSISFGKTLSGIPSVIWVWEIASDGSLLFPIVSTSSATGFSVETLTNDGTLYYIAAVGTP